MTPDALYESLHKIAKLVVDDPRWEDQKDDLGVAVLGMLMYGYALNKGRIAFMLDIEEIDAAVIRCIMDTVGSAERWTIGLVEDAAKSAFDQEYHPGQFELIGVGHQYFPEGKYGGIVNNIFQNIESMRGAA